MVQKELLEMIFLRKEKAMETTTYDADMQSSSSAMIDMASIQITPVGVCCP